MNSKLLAKIFFGGLFFLFLVGRAFPLVSGPLRPPPPPPPDTTGPSVSITSPAEGFMVTTPEVVIQGTASDASGVTGVSYVVEGGHGGFGAQATGTTSWTADITGLFGGTNTIRVRAWDSLSNATEVTIHIYFFQQTPLTVLINGEGTVKPNLNGMILESGKVIEMAEKPKKGYVVAGWSGDIGVKGDTLVCMMQSNMVVQANFVPTPFIPVSGNYEGNISALMTNAPGGSFRAKITKTGKFSGRVRLDKKSYPLSGVFWVDGLYSGILRRKGYPTVGVQLQLNFNDGAISGVLTDMSLSSDEPTGEVLATMKTKPRH